MYAVVGSFHKAPAKTKPINFFLVLFRMREEFQDRMEPLPRQSKVPEKPDWAKKVSELRSRLGLNQSEFGRKLHSSAMAISRWERGAQEPLAQSYIELGNLAGASGCWYFWGRAGLSTEDVMKVMPETQERLHRTLAPAFAIVGAGSGKKKTEKTQLLTIPLLKVSAAAHGEKGGHISLLLHDPQVETLIAAPTEWCPNPSFTSCLRVQGRSMEPTICDGDIVAVDSSQTDTERLNGKVVLAWNEENGLTISRLRRYDHTEVLQPENNQYESITLGHKSKKWKVVAKALWWIRRSS